MILALPKRSASPRQGGMTLVEMIVSVGLLVAIVFGLTAAFNQTQRIFRAGLNQTDRLEGGRAALDFIRRDFEPSMAMPANLPLNTIVAAIGLETLEDPIRLTVPGVSAPGSAGVATNVFEKVFFLRPTPTNYVGVGYRVLNLNLSTTNLSLPTTPGFVGTLYRFSEDNLPPPAPSQVLYFSPPYLASTVMSQFVSQFNSQVTLARLLNQQYLNPVIEGVVHFQINLYDRSGNLMTNSIPSILEETGGGFFVRAVNAPVALVEVELGVLDTPVVEQYKARFPAGTAFAAGLVEAFLASHSGNIHYYRTLIPLRSNLASTPLP
jgi:hypothetical protein